MVKDNNIEQILNATDNVKKITEEIKNGYERLKENYLKCAKEKDIALNFIIDIASEISKTQSISSKKYLEMAQSFIKEYNEVKK